MSAPGIGAHHLTATVEVDPNPMRTWLPFGVRLPEPARTAVSTAWVTVGGSEHAPLRPLTPLSAMTPPRPRVL